MADIKGVEGVINFLKLSNALNFAIYDIYKQNKLPLFKTEAQSTQELINRFKEFSESLKNKNYDIVIIKSESEKLKFTFSNQTEETEQKPAVGELSGIIEKLNALTSREPQQTANPYFEKYLEKKFHCEALERQIKGLEDELNEVSNYADELELRLKILDEKLKNEDKFEKYYAMFKNESGKETKKSAVNDNIAENANIDKKEILKSIIQTLTKNLSEAELINLAKILPNKINLIKTFLK